MGPARLVMYHVTSRNANGSRVGVRWTPPDKTGLAQTTDFCGLRGPEGPAAGGMPEKFRFAKS